MTKAEFFDRDSSCYFFEDKIEIGEYCRTYWQEDVEHILRVAEEVCRKEFLFDLKWDMERTYEPVIFEQEIQWDYMPGDDPEFIFQFNRHRFFICLGQAYAITGDEKYAKVFTELLMDWIQKVPLTKESQKTTWRTIEAGLRGEFWTKAFYYFRESSFLTDEVVDAFYQCMMVHAEYLVEYHSIMRRMSNWSILEDHGLFMIALMLPQSEKTREYAKIALEHLEVEARLQILPDGMQWEQSPMYHNEVYHCFLDVLILASRNGVVVPSAIRDRTYKMAFANVAWKKPNGHQFINGDSDDTDVRDYISIGAWVFSDPVLKKAGLKRLDFESVWDLGMKAAREYEQMETAPIPFLSLALSDSGNYYLRTDWGEEANLLHFHCGTLGAGHGHSDKLHVDLVIHGEDVLMDSGRFNYVAGPNRYEFKDPMAHNTITVDGKLFTICKDSWECSKLSAAVNQKHCFTEQYEFVQGGHLGYMDLENGVFVNRKVIYIKPDVYLLVDELYSGGEHSYCQYFHFNNEGEVELFAEEQKAVYRGKKAKADLYFITPGVEMEKKRTRVSRNYNQAEDQTTITVQKKQKGFTSLITVIFGQGAEGEETCKVEKIRVRSEFKDVIHPDSWAEAVKISVHGKEYVVIVCHQEVNTPTDQTEADGCLGFGQVLVFDKELEKQVGTVLLW
ncbi:MAG: alginate lyase family protein [Lachnospiraceae bacterium]|nr:alginate lyase family protein [Lachnospiraceae bacterium]